MKPHLAAAAILRRPLSLLVALALLVAACGSAAPATPAPAAPTQAAASPIGEALPDGEPTAPPEEPQPIVIDCQDCEPTPPPATEGGAGTIVADSGFRPEINGFQFENYGKSDAVDLTPAELRRIYGDVVCASIVGDECTLTPPAEQWMVQQNQGMEGGHCYGFSVAALRMFMGFENPADFGAPTPIDLPLAGNELLQRDIAYSFVFQGFDPVQGNQIGGTPNEVLDRLIENLKAGKSAPETYTIGFFMANGEGGHAVTPYAVEDRGNGIFAVLIYDNNYPKESRAILFDRTANTWNYTTTTNPSEPTSEYQGTAETKSLFLFPTTPGLPQQACSFCAGEPAASAGSSRTASLNARPAPAAPAAAAPGQRYNELYLDGDPSVHAHLLITDEAGKQYGYLPDGRFVTGIPGVKSERTFSGLDDDTPEPVYFVPTGMAFQVTIDGTPLQGPDLTDVTMIGPGYALGVIDIGLDPGQQDTLTFAPDGSRLSYQTTSTESPSIVLGVQLDGADYEFEVKGVDVAGGGTINVSIDTTEGFLAIDTDGTESAGQYALKLSRFDDAGEQSYEHDDITLEPTDQMLVYYGQWSGNGGTLELGIDLGSDGTVDDSVTLTDED